MGKVIIIKNADFSNVAVERIEYDNPERTVFAVIEEDDYYYYDNYGSSTPTLIKFDHYGSLKVDVSSFVGNKVVVSGATSSTTALIRIDDADNNCLYRKVGSNKTIVKDEVIIPVGAKWAYLNNYFSWDASPFSYMYELE